MTKHLTNQKPVACITGASQGIGATIAEVLADRGYAIALNFHNEDCRENADLVAQRIRQTGGQVACFKADVADEAEVDAMFSAIDDAFGRMDLLVNNAGWESIEHALDLSPGNFRRAMDVNLNGLFICSQQAARRMLKTGGSIVNILSIHDEVPRKGSAHYCAAKAGALMLTKSLALEWAEYRIRVNAISPGAVKTEMNREIIENLGEDFFVHKIPLGRFGTMEEVAEIVAFLAGDNAQYITGTTLYADGGYRLTTIPYDPRPKQ